MMMLLKVGYKMIVMYTQTVNQMLLIPAMFVTVIILNAQDVQMKKHLIMILML